MKKLIIGSVAVGAVMALGPVVRRRTAQKMREHCRQMTAQLQPRGEATGHEAMHREALALKMRAHCEQMAARHGGRRQPVGHGLTACACDGDAGKRS